jgi:protein-tyrosine phosphatase
MTDDYFPMVMELHCMMHTLLFLCTGNYYRSRFAELIFNAVAPERQLPWQAVSRGLALEKGVKNVGPISQTALATLRALGIVVPTEVRYPLQVQEGDLSSAAFIIALQEAEHRPLLHARYPAWADKVAYWHVRDVTPSAAYNPLREIEQEVRRLVHRLAQSLPDAPKT